MDNKQELLINIKREKTTAGLRPLYRPDSRLADIPLASVHAHTQQGAPTTAVYVVGKQ